MVQLIDPLVLTTNEVEVRHDGDDVDAGKCEICGSPMAEVLSSGDLALWCPGCSTAIPRLIRGEE